MKLQGNWAKETFLRLAAGWSPILGKFPAVVDRSALAWQMSLALGHAAIVTWILVTFGLVLGFSWAYWSTSHLYLEPWA